MRTFPDFTWEWIIESCRNLCNQIQSGVGGDSQELPERLKGYIENAQGLIAIVPKLREHPQLEKLVPMKSLMSLVWFPSKDHEICLYCEESKVKYSITIVKGDLLRGHTEIHEKKIVAFDEVADQIYTYIMLLNDE